MQIVAFKNLIIIVTALFCSYNFTVLAQTATFNTVTEALNYTGDKAAVTKLVITGTISGNDYSESSEWSKFRTLNKTFPNIEEVEILTDQDIPDYDEIGRALFYNNTDFWNGINIKWLKSFSAPNVKYIGRNAFYKCSNLTSINFPVVTTIKEVAFADCSSLTSINFPVATTIGCSAFDNCSSLTSVNFPVATAMDIGAFADCSNLTSVDFPLVTRIGYMAFVDCKKLVSATFGIGFKTKTKINFGENVFYTVTTQNVDLILGENVLPKPDLTANTWQSDNAAYGGKKDYVWKSITITDGIEEIIKNNTVSIFPNPTVENATVTFELEKSCNVKIVLCDILGIEQMNIYDGFANEGFFTETISIEHLPKGVYFLKILIDKDYITEKIIIE